MLGSYNHSREALPNPAPEAMAAGFEMTKDYQETG
jgi:hypothetical protein